MPTACCASALDNTFGAWLGSGVGAGRDGGVFHQVLRPLGFECRLALRARGAVLAPARFRGIRFSTAFDPDIKINRPRTHAKDKLFTDTTFHGGLKVLFDMGLSFDAWLYHRQIPELTDLARAFPDAPIVLDHCGGRLGLGPYADKER